MVLPEPTQLYLIFPSTRICRISARSTRSLNHFRAPLYTTVHSTETRSRRAQQSPLSRQDVDVRSPSVTSCQRSTLRPLQHTT